MSCLAKFLGFEEIAFYFLVQCHYQRPFTPNNCISEHKRHKYTRSRRQREDLFSVEAWLAVWSTSRESFPSIPKGNMAYGGCLPFATTVLLQRRR